MATTATDPEEGYTGKELGLFAPVFEERSIDGLKVRGTLPDGFRGSFYRNGPNPQFKPRGRYHHFDGDGMIHALHFGDEGVSYVNKWVRTDRFHMERRAGRALFGGFLDPGAVDPSVKDMPATARCAANTHVVWHHGRCLALNERGLAWAVDPITLETLSREDYDGRLVGTNCTAHPHIDGENGDMLFYGYGIDASMPDLAVYIVDRDNRLKMNALLDTPYRSMIHDSLITRDYFILPHLPITIDHERTKRGEPHVKWEPDRGSHLAFIPRAGDVAQTIWVDMDPLYVYHFYNAYQQDDGTVIIDAAAQATPAGIPGSAKGTPQVLERWHVDLAERRVKRTVVNDRAADFPRIDERLQGHRHRFGFAVGMDGGEGAAKLRSIHRFDFDTSGHTVRELGPTRITSEAVFIPAGPEAPPEQGYLGALVTDETDGRSEFLVLNADDIDGEPVATVELPIRVPSGFHANWRSGSAH